MIYVVMHLVGNNEASPYRRTQERAGFFLF